MSESEAKRTKTEDVSLKTFVEGAGHFQRILYSICYEKGAFYMKEGIGIKEGAIVVITTEDCVTVADMTKRKLIRVNGKAVSGIEHNQVLNLNDEGERWEGDVDGNEPYGWGVLYDDEGEKRYEGFHIISENMLYGTLYYSDIQKIEYEGNWCAGKRWGRGAHYDRNGRVVYEGEWINGDHLETRGMLRDVNQLLHNCIEELIVPSHCCNEKEWKCVDFSLVSALRVLEVGDDCFKSVMELKLIGMKALERVVIGASSFMGHKGSFCLKKCPLIRELKIGHKSFWSYDLCEIEENDRLEVIEMGRVNDDDASTFCSASLMIRGSSRRVK